MSGGHVFAGPRFGGSQPALPSYSARPHAIYAGPGELRPPPRPRRTWLWIVGIATVVVLCISTFMVTGGAIITALVHSAQFDASPDPAATGAALPMSATPVTLRLTEAMNANDRGAFVGTGQGAVATHLAAIWDETKKLGWTLGIAEATEETGSVQLAFNMQLGGFHAVAADGPDAPGGELLATFLYDATISGTGSASTLTALDATYPMPWDRGETIAVARGDHVALFADADEAALASDRVAEAEAAAADVLARPEWNGSPGRLDGFVSYVTQSDDDFRAAYGPGIGDGVAGFCQQDIRPADGSAETVKGLATGSYPGGALAVMGPSGLEFGDGYVFAHEFAHYMQNTFDPAPLTGSDDGRAFIEGYAESVAAQFADAAGDLFTTGEVRDTVLSGDISAAVAPSSFDDTEKVDTAYLTAGSYFYFLDQQHADYRGLLAADGTRPFADEIAATMPEGLRIEDWQAWMAAQ